MGDDPRNSINKPDAGTLESADGVLLLRVVDVLRLRSMYAWHTDEETPCRTYWISALKKRLWFTDRSEGRDLLV